MQQRLARNLSNVVVGNAKVDVTVASKNYGVQNYAAVPIVLNYHKTNIPTVYRSIFKVSSKTLGKGVNLV